jgi:hypothetical protein
MITELELDPVWLWLPEDVVMGGQIMSTGKLGRHSEIEAVAHAAEL